ncbi:hypothetical protein NYE37_13900 [Thermoactinomyces sp. FSL K6-2592]|uniref:hypothetical protein n=1 Tax=Thermoactinomyces sp. FSL K6-2592 TaxID=2975347 RepID=UPI0030FA1BE5
MFSYPLESMKIPVIERRLRESTLKHEFYSSFLVEIGYYIACQLTDAGQGTRYEIPGAFTIEVVGIQKENVPPIEPPYMTKERYEKSRVEEVLAVVDKKGEILRVFYYSTGFPLKLVYTHKKYQPATVEDYIILLENLVDVMKAFRINRLKYFNRRYNTVNELLEHAMNLEEAGAYSKEWVYRE